MIWPFFLSSSDLFPWLSLPCSALTTFCQAFGNSPFSSKKKKITEIPIGRSGIQSQVFPTILVWPFQQVWWVTHFSIRVSWSAPRVPYPSNLSVIAKLHSSTALPFSTAFPSFAQLLLCIPQDAFQDHAVLKKRTCSVLYLPGPTPTLVITFLMKDTFCYQHLLLGKEFLHIGTKVHLSPWPQWYPRSRVPLPFSLSGLVC